MEWCPDRRTKRGLRFSSQRMMAAVQLDEEAGLGHALAAPPVPLGGGSEGSRPQRLATGDGGHSCRGEGRGAVVLQALP